MIVYEVDENGRFIADENGNPKQQKWPPPRADMVFVVRCKDCKYHDEEDGKNFCDCGNRPDDWFCADGERRNL